jgi:hypothetical protein
MIEINDEESLKKENITIELFTKEFIQKPINLKNKIEKEINEINNNYNNIKNQINKNLKKNMKN